MLRGESVPECREGDGVEPLTEGEDVLSRIEQDPAMKLLTDKLLKRTKPLEVTRGNGRRGLHLHSYEAAIPRLHQHIYLFALGGVPVVETRGGLAPACILDQLQRHKVFQTRSLQPGRTSLACAQESSLRWMRSSGPTHERWWTMP